MNFLTLTSTFLIAFEIQFLATSEYNLIPFSRAGTATSLFARSFFCTCKWSDVSVIAAQKAALSLFLGVTLNSWKGVLANLSYKISFIAFISLLLAISRNLSFSLFLKTSESHSFKLSRYSFS